MNKVPLIFTLLIMLLSCKKDSNSSEPAEKYYFNYTIDGKSGGHAFSKAGVDVFPNSQWSTLTDSLGIEVTGGTYPNVTYNNSFMTSFNMTTINGWIQSNCNENGKSNCFGAFVRLDTLVPGTFTPGHGLQAVDVHELNVGQYLYSGFAYYPASAKPGETMSVTINSVGAVGGLIKGTFLGKILRSNGSLIDVSGNFSVVRTH